MPVLLGKRGSSKEALVRFPLIRRGRMGQRQRKVTGLRRLDALQLDKLRQALGPRANVLALDRRPSGTQPLLRSTCLAGHVRWVRNPLNPQPTKGAAGRPLQHVIDRQGLHPHHRLPNGWNGHSRHDNLPLGVPRGSNLHSRNGELTLASRRQGSKALHSLRRRRQRSDGRRTMRGSQSTEGGRGRRRTYRTLWSRLWQPELGT